MKIACDRCLKIGDANSYGVNADWLSITDKERIEYNFCPKCADVFWNTMFSNNNEDEERKDGETDGTDI